MRYKEDFAGGVSRVATITFDTAFFAGGAVDLRFTNDTTYGVLIEAGINRARRSRDSEMWVRTWSTKYRDITGGSDDSLRKEAMRTSHTPPDTVGCVGGSGA